MERNGEQLLSCCSSLLLVLLLRMPTAVPKPAPFKPLFLLPSCSTQIQQTSKGREGVNGKILGVKGNILGVSGKMLGVKGKMLGVNNAGAHREGRRIPSKQEGSGSGSFFLPYFFHTLLPLSLNNSI